MNTKTAKKIAYVVNTVMLLMVFGLMAFFKLLDADFLVYFSIPTALVYVISYFLVYTDHLEIYLWFCYCWLVLYMAVTTVFLGESYGFHLYCFSMIPVVYVVEYMSFRIGRKGVKALYISIIIALIYFVFMSYVMVNGPIYDRGKKYAPFFWIFNSLTVFGYLVIYTNYLIRNIIKSEKKLSEMAHRDRLTKLYNRHYMLEKLSELPEGGKPDILAMVDIDDFKKINDTYGHNAGDEVLKVISSKMTASCEGCVIARWGGEEFLILCQDDEQLSHEMLDKMRAGIGSEPVVFEDSSIKVTITVGMSRRNSGDTIDEWIHQIDKKLYKGKKSGKNRVVV